MERGLFLRVEGVVLVQQIVRPIADAFYVSIGTMDGRIEAGDASVTPFDPLD
jgi:hypothetical protein